MIVLDTHVLIWAATRERRLGRKSRALIEAAWAGSSVAVSALSFWEAGLLHDRRRIALPAAPAQWRDQLLAAGLGELPVDGWIAVRALDLSGLSPDPVDRLIAATALRHNAILMTADDTTLGWAHALQRHDARS